MKERFVLVAALAIFCLAYFFSRASFFICPLVDWTSDSFGYMTAVQRILNGETDIGISTFYFGYASFTYLLLKLYDSIYTIVITQHAVTFLCGIFLIYSTYRYYRIATVGVAVALAVFILSASNSYYDSYILTESLYVNSLIFIFSLGLHAFHSRSKSVWALFSIATFIPLAIRPPGIFAALVFTFVVTILVLKRETYRNIILAYVSPFVLLAIIMAVLNVFVLNQVSAASAAHISQEMNYESSAKKRPAEFEKASFSKVIKHYSWIKEYKRADWYKHLVYQKFFEWDWPNNLQFAHPDSLYKIKERVNYKFLQREGVDGEQLRKDVFKEYYYPDKIAPLKGKYEKLKSSIVYKGYDFFEIYIYEPVFRRMVWVYVFFITLILSLVLLINSRFSDPLALSLTLLGLLNLGHNFLHIMVAHRTLPRYGYPIEFTYYVAAALLPLVIMRVYKIFKTRHD